MLSNLWRYRRFILSMGWHDLKVRYAGSAFGSAWHLFLPLSQILVYSLVFSSFMKMRLSTEGGLGINYGFYLCVGLFPWLAFSGAIFEGSQALLQHAHSLRKLPVPEEVFVAQTVTSNTLGLLVALGLLLLLGPVFGQWPGFTVLALLPLILQFQLLAFGIALFLAVLSPFFRDIGPALNIVLQLWMWLNPIVYDESILDSTTLAVLAWNPAFVFIQSFHQIVLYDRVPSFGSWFTMLVWVVVALGAGLALLRRLRPEIREVL